MTAEGGREPFYVKAVTRDTITVVRRDVVRDAVTGKIIRVTVKEGSSVVS